MFKVSFKEFHKDMFESILCNIFDSDLPPFLNVLNGSF